MKFKISVSILLFVCGIYSFAQGPLRDPRILDGEKLKYKTTEGDKTFITEMEVRKSQIGNKETYFFTSKTPESKLELTVEALEMESVRSFSDQVSAGAGYTTEMNLTHRPVLLPGEFLVLRTTELGFLLRGYPFNRPANLGVFILGSSRDSGFRLEVQFSGTEDLNINGRIQSTYKLELVSHLSGAMALFGGMVPKVYFWYTRTGVPTLVKYQGGAGFGSKAQIMEILN